MDALIFIALIVVVILLVGLLITVRRSGTSKAVDFLPLKPEFGSLEASIKAELRSSREELQRGIASQTDAIRQPLTEFSASIQTQLHQSSESQLRELAVFADQLEKLRQATDGHLDKIRGLLETSISKLQSDIQSSLKNSGEAAEKLLMGLTDGVNRSMTDASTNQRTQLQSFQDQLNSATTRMEERLEAVRGTIETGLTTLRTENTEKLEQIRVTVDEKLQTTLDRRLSESFKFVSERLDLVHKGLNDMQSLAIGVGDLQRVLTNIKSRGTWAEVQLGALLEEVLTPDQFDKNVTVKKGSREIVEFAIRLPEKNDSERGHIWMPLDAKFPIEDYHRLTEAQEGADLDRIASARRDLANSIKSEAKKIRDKYINPPVTTDFAVMYLPAEGLFAEALRIPGLTEMLQREYKVMIAGPTTLLALLNCFQLGFRTLAIQKRSSEVWQLLSVVKREFGNFGTLIAKTKKKLQEAANVVGEVEKRGRVITRNLKNVAELPQELNTPLEIAAGIPSLPDSTAVITLDGERHEETS